MGAAEVKVRWVPNYKPLKLEVVGPSLWADLVKNLNEKVCECTKALFEFTKPEFDFCYMMREVTLVYDGFALLAESGLDPTSHTIYLGTWEEDPYSDRVMWAVAHELAHCYMPPVRGVLAVSAEEHDSLSYEKWADRVASMVVTTYSRERYRADMIA